MEHREWPKWLKYGYIVGLIVFLVSFVDWVYVSLCFFVAHGPGGMGCMFFSIPIVSGQVVLSVFDLNFSKLLVDTPLFYFSLFSGVLVNTIIAFGIGALVGWIVQRKRRC